MGDTRREVGKESSIQFGHTVYICLWVCVCVCPYVILFSSITLEHVEAQFHKVLTSSPDCCWASLNWACDQTLILSSGYSLLSSICVLLLAFVVEQHGSSKKLTREIPRCPSGLPLLFDIFFFSSCCCCCFSARRLLPVEGVEVTEDAKEPS